MAATNSLGENPEAWRTAYRSAATWFLKVADHAATQPDSPALGTWTVRDLLGHTGRALSTPVAYLGATGPIEIDTAAHYFRAAAAVDPDVIAERGREAGHALGDEPVATLQSLADEVSARIDTAADDDLLGSAVGVLTLAEYLPTRTFELVVHTCDLAAATGLPLDPPLDAAASALRLAADIAAAGTAARAGSLLLALTGRSTVAADVNVLVAE